MENIISKIKKAKLVGRGGACFPVDKKWQAVKKSSGDKHIIANGAEGEPGVKKDEYILANYPKEVINGIKIASKYLGSTKNFLYLNHNFKYLEKNLREVIKKEKINIEIIYKPKNVGYVGGEETALIKVIEGDKVEARLKPPYPVEKGLYNQPTLINNIETLYNISLASRGKYKNERFYTVSGDCCNPGVFKLKDNLNISEILEKTKNNIDEKYFVQVGGDASGEILNNNQLDKLVSGAGSITIYKLDKNKRKEIVKKLVDFYVKNSCGRCTPCREGTYRLQEMLNDKEKMDWNLFIELLNNLGNNSICALGSSLPIPLKSYFKNVNPEFNKMI